MRVVFLMLLLLISTSAFAKEAQEIRAKMVLIRNGFYAGYVYEINGHDYILNAEGGILEIKP